MYCFTVLVVESRMLHRAGTINVGKVSSISGRRSIRRPDIRGLCRIIRAMRFNVRRERVTYLAPRSVHCISAGEESPLPLFLPFFPVFFLSAQVNRVRLWKLIIAEFIVKAGRRDTGVNPR